MTPSAVASLVSYPIDINPHTKQVLHIRTSADFIAQYDSIITPHIADVVSETEVRRPLRQLPGSHVRLRRGPDRRNLQRQGPASRPTSRSEPSRTQQAKRTSMSTVSVIFGGFRNFLILLPQKMLEKTPTRGRPYYSTWLPHRCAPGHRCSERFLPRRSPRR